jgi:hypothetical protein
MKSLISAALGMALVVSLYYFEPVMTFVIAFILCLVIITPMGFDDEDYSTKKDASTGTADVQK